jgi:hypothetical protein
MVRVYHDEPPSNFAFHFNLRRYSVGAEVRVFVHTYNLTHAHNERSGQGGAG